MASITWGTEVAEVYDTTYAAMSEPPVLGPMVGVLAELAQGGPAIGVKIPAIGGRIALPVRVLRPSAGSM